MRAVSPHSCNIMTLRYALTMMFSYMCFLIVFKWLTNWAAPGMMEAPRLLNLMIEMCLSPFSLSDQYHIYPGQVPMALWSGEQSEAEKRKGGGSREGRENERFSVIRETLFRIVF